MDQIQETQSIFTLKSLSKIYRPTRKHSKIKVDLSMCQYPLLRRIVIKQLGWRVWRKKDDSFLCWNDSYIHQSLLKKLLPYQRINRFPGSYQLGRKNNLAINLRRLQDLENYPKTFLLPKEIQQFRTHVINNTGFYIAKPQASCQGRGIQPVIRPLHYTPLQPMVVQQFIDNPYLIDGLKFDFRIYVLLQSVHPLRILMYKQGLARLATQQYKCLKQAKDFKPTIHMTNYAINKINPAFIFNKNKEMDDQGHKRSMSAVLNQMAKKGCNVKTLLSKIKSLITKTFLTVSPRLKQMSKKSLPGQCFQLFGFDILIKNDLQPMLIQVNHTPSLKADTPLDLQIKKYLVLDTILSLGINQQDKNNYSNKGANFRLPSIKSSFGAYQIIYDQQTNRQFDSSIRNVQKAWVRKLPSLQIGIHKQSKQSKDLAIMSRPCSRTTLRSRLLSERNSTRLPKQIFIALKHKRESVLKLQKSQIDKQKKNKEENLNFYKQGLVSYFQFKSKNKEQILTCFKGPMLTCTTKRLHQRKRPDQQI